MRTKARLDKEDLHLLNSSVENRGLAVTVPRAVLSAVPKRGCWLHFDIDVELNAEQTRV